MNEKMIKLKSLLTEIYDLERTEALLSWDQLVMMPPGGAAARGRQMALLSKLAHEKKIAPELGRLLEELQPLATSLPAESDEACLIKVATRDYQKAMKVPASFMGELSEHIAATYEAWVKAREAENFGVVAPLFGRTLEFSQQLAEFQGDYQHVADPLIDVVDEGFTVAMIRPLFTELRNRLKPLVERIAASQPVEDSCVKKYFPEAGQLQFGKEVITKYGFDFSRGRDDLSVHPFTTSFSIGDVRITTRIKLNDLNDALFSTLHEAGHGLYEQGFAKELEGTPLASGASSGMHESQSRLWENLVGRSRGFWEHFYPRLQEIFPEQLGKVSLETFYRAINKVEPSLIRTEADEVTYNLHVMIRFELELQLLEGTLSVKDLPEAWNEMYRNYLGIVPKNYQQGVLQDIHWYGGTIGGAFQCYTLGNIMSAQIFAAALAAQPQIKTEISQGEFATLRNWLTKNVYRHGRKFSAAELIQMATGKPLTIEPYFKYLENKYQEIY